MTFRPLLPCLVLVSTLVACAGEEDTSSLASASNIEALQPSDGENDNGTRLSATGAAGAAVCTEAGTTAVPFTGTVTSTGSDDEVRVTASVDGAAWTLVGTILTEDFTYDERVKTAAYEVLVPVGQGSHSVKLCFEQDGNEGRHPKKVCLEPAYAVTVELECNVCTTVEHFGNISNKDVCKGNPLNLHVRGNFGQAASVTISGPNGYSHTGDMREGDDECTWNYQWHPGSTATAGTYSFQVTGANGEGYSYSESLKCK